MWVHQLFQSVHQLQRGLVLTVMNELWFPEPDPVLSTDRAL